MKRVWIAFVVLVVLSLGTFQWAVWPWPWEDVVTVTLEGAEPTDADRLLWARPIEKEGVPNLHKVTPHIYRGGQRTPEGLRRLDEMGMETVINLRSLHSDRDEMQRTDMLDETAGHRPDDPRGLRLP
ncbi:MAG: hypothetical protein ACLFVU_11770 [Phycisphaerae bacterium]